MNSPDLPKAAWRDPALVFEDAESATCKGCAWIGKVAFQEIQMPDPDHIEFCRKGRLHLKRCADYLETSHGK